MGPIATLYHLPEWADLLFALFIGMGFGFALEQAGFSSSRKLAGMFYGYDTTVLKVFFTAAIIALAGAQLLSFWGLLDLSLVFVNEFYVNSVIIGGVIKLIPLTGITLPFVSYGGSSIVANFVLLALLLFLTTWRYYAEVEFRLNLTFRNYFIFYIALTIGYLVGYAGFVVLHDWYIIFLLGELAALTYVWVKGSIFHPIWQRGEHFPRVLKASSTLAVSYLIANSSLQLDRILLKFFVSNIAVTEYYVVSLIGKALVMVVAPLNSIILSYLTRRESGITRKSFLSYLALILLGCAVFFALCQLVVPIFIKLLYPDMYTSVKGLILIANLAQIIAVGSSAIFAVVLTFAHEKWQLILQAAHIVLFVAIAIPLTKSQGVYGFALSSVIANTLRMLSIVAFGIINGGKRESIH